MNNMKKLVIEKIFDAEIEKVWKAFTTSEILGKWWSPEGMSSSYISVDLKEGGKFRFCFKGSDGKEFWGLGIYKKIEKPKNLSYLDTFSDSDGNPVPPSHFGMPGDEIIESLVEIAFSKDGNKTHMKISMDNYYDDSMTKDMIKGWNSMFDKLTKIL